MEQDLFFNVLTFDWPKEPQTLYFSLVNTPRTKRIHRSSFPQDLATIFPQLNSENVEFVYTSFGYKQEGFLPLPINLQNANNEFAKHFYRDTLRYYFRSVKKQIVRLGFIDELEIFVPSKKHSTTQLSVFERFSIRVQIQDGSKFPSLLVTYEGKSKVLQTPIPELLKQVAPGLIKKVKYDNQILKYDDFLDLADTDVSKCYPLLNSGLVKHLNLTLDRPTKENKYKRYYNQINTFYDYFLNKQAFKKLIPIHEQGFLKVPALAIGEIKPESSDLAFHENKVGRNPKKDFYALKPAEKSPHKKVHIFFVYHVDDEAKKNDMKTYLQTGVRHYRGLYGYTGILNFIDDAASISFKDKLNPIPELEAKWISHKHDTVNIKYLAIYLTPFSKEETRRQDQKVYVMIKEFLLKRKVVCQSVEPGKIGGENTDFVFSLTNMSVAILAKLEGIPWRLHTDLTNELIVGVGAFKNPTDGVRYLSSAFSFDNTGRFNSFDYFMQNEINELAGSISAKVREFAMVNGVPNRLIIHFYKRLSEEELLPIEKALQELEFPQPIPIFIISINKTESTDIVAFDKSFPELIPISGTYISIGNKKYLLFNNARTATSFNKFDGFHFPVKLAIDCNKKELLNDVKIIHDLINQVYQFSRMYWKSLSQQNLPVTIKYPEMIAEIAPYFSDVEIPSYGKDKLWFL